MLTLLAVEFNDPNPVDIIFFVIIGIVIAICVAIYFLIPVINKKQYQEMRDNLNKREVAFKANLKGGEAMPETNADTSADAEQTPVEQADQK